MEEYQYFETLEEWQAYCDKLDKQKQLEEVEEV